MIVRQVQREDVDQLAALYVACFSEPPWNELFELGEVIVELMSYLSCAGAVFVVAEVDERVIGAAVGYPIESTSTLPEAITNAERGAFYIAEIFVSAAQRIRGAATRLTDELHCRAREKGYVRGVVRTSIHQSVIRYMFEARGFRVAHYQEVISAKSIEGEMRMVSDTRVIMIGDL